MVVGYLRPMILLPASVLTGLTPAQLESLLAHELAHVRRHDWLVNAVQVVVETFLFYHPAVWWLSSRIRDERELCCDDIALKVIGDKATYGRMLLALEELRHATTRDALTVPASLAATGGSLVARIRRLMPSQHETQRASRGWLSGAVALAVLASLCGVWFATQATAENGGVAKNDVAKAEKDEAKKDATASEKDGESSSNAEAPHPQPLSPQSRGEGSKAKPDENIVAAAPAKFDATAEIRRHVATRRVGLKDWPEWCGSPHRNNTPSGENIPITWDLKTGENVLWKVEHTRGNMTTPVIANGKVYVAGNNQSGAVPRHPKTEDLGCLRAHDTATGELLWQATHPKLAQGKDGGFRDWPMIGVCSPPTVEGERLWYVSNRGDVVCLDTEGFRDGENDGPIVDEKERDQTDADFIWQVDLVKDFGIETHLVSASAILCVGDRLFVITSNGVGGSHLAVINPQAPSFVCLDKHTGKVLWTDNSPKENILAGCWSSPCGFEINGETQIVMPGGDGWLYSFSPEGDGQGQAKLLWKFDANPKESKYTLATGRSDRNSILATPVFYDGLVYVGVGANPEHGEGTGVLWCIDPTKRGDVSPELAVDAKDQPLPQRRIQAVIKENGERAIPNPNSAAVWSYKGSGELKNGKPTFEGTFHRTLGNVAIKHDLLFVSDFGGLVHCLDAKPTNGQPVVHWTHDFAAAAWGTPLIVEDKVYIGNEDGIVTIFALSKTKQVIAELNCGDQSIQTTPVVANDTLYIDTVKHLIALKQKPKPEEKPQPAKADTENTAKKGDAKEVRKRVVRVMDEEKKPVVGAKVRYQFQNDKTIFASLSMFTGIGPKAETDKQGEFSEEIPEGAERVIITVTAEGFGEFSETQGASGSTVVTMKRGRVIKVRAVDENEKILKQAVPLLNEHRVWGREFVLQKDGTFKSPSVALNRKLMRVAAAQDDGPMLFSELIDVSIAKPGEDGVLQLTLKPGTRIEGKLDDSVPRPVGEGYVELCLVEAENHTLGRPAWEWNDFTPVKPDGTFVFESVPSGGHAQIHVLVNGYISKKPTADSLKAYIRDHKLADEKAVEQQLEHLDFRAMRGLFVTLDKPVVTTTVACEQTASCDFLLLDPSGKPVPNVQVRFNPNGAFTFGRQFNPISLSYESLLVEELHKHPTVTWNWNASLPHGREAKQQHDWMNRWIDRVTSDAEGRVRVRNLPGRGRASFLVESTDYVLPVSPLLGDKNIARLRLDDDSYRYGEVELVSGETAEKTVFLERKQPAVDREFVVISSNGKPLEHVEFSVAELRVGAKEWQTWSTQRFGTLPRGSTDKAGRVVLRMPSQIDKTPIERLRLGINYEFKDGLWLSRQVVEVPLNPDDGVIALLPNPVAGREGRAVYGKLEDLLAKSSPKEWLDTMIKGPNVAVLRRLLASSKIKHPEPVALIDDGRYGDKEKGGKVHVVNTGDAKFAVVLARVRPLGGALASENDLKQLPECAFVFDTEGAFLAALGGNVGATESVEVLSLGPEEDWFVRVTKFEDNGPFEYQSDYYRIAKTIVPSLRYFHYANSNGWSNGPEEITRWGELSFDFPSRNDQFDSPGHSGDGGPAQTADGVPVIRDIIWDADRNRFVGAAAQFGKGKGLYEVDLNGSKEFEAVAPKRNQLFVTGGERDYDHWHSWQTVVPDKHELLLTITIPQAEGEPKVIEKKLASGKRHIQVQLNPNKDNTSARLELRVDKEQPEVSESPIQLGDRPEKHPPITHLLNPGDSARVLTRTLKAPAGTGTVDLKLLAQ